MKQFSKGIHHCENKSTSSLKIKLNFKKNRIGGSREKDKIGKA